MAKTAQKSKKPKQRAVGKKHSPKTSVAISKNGLQWRARFRKILRGIVFIGVIIALMPIALLFLYKIPSVHPVSTLMISAKITGNPVRREWVDIDDISPVLMHSVMVSEDAKFCAHSGVDWEAVNTIIDNALDGEKTRGASTISMQTVKNLFLWNGRSYVRKGLELPLAMAADLILGKRRLMEIYLNVAEWDAGVYGIGAASRHYFSRKSDRLSARQSALLAVSLPNPIGRNPSRPGKGLNRLARRIEKRAYQSGAYVKCLKS